MVIEPAEKTLTRSYICEYTLYDIPSNCVFHALGPLPTKIKLGPDFLS